MLSFTISFRRRLAICVACFLLLSLGAVAQDPKEGSPKDVYATDDGPTDDKAPGIGVEFESGQVAFKSDGHCSIEDTVTSKGKVVNSRKGDYWELTADTTANMEGRLQAEYILDGKKITLDTGKAGKVAAEVADDLKSWSPNADDKNKKEVKVADSKCNPWSITEPKKNAKVENLYWLIQVTAPMPLEAISELVELARENKDSPLLPLLKSRKDNFVSVRSAFFKSRPHGITTNAKQDVLGFFSLVLTYAKNADKVHAGESPKMRSSIMPRTDFATMYKMIKPNLGVDLKKGDLYNLVKFLACFTSREDDDGYDIDDNYCSGSEDSPKPKDKLDKTTFNIEYQNKKSPVSVKDWINGIQDDGKDKLAEADKIIDGQVGGLGSASEKVLHTDRLVPLFEFRDLGSSTSPDFKKDVEKVEKEIVKYHKLHANAPRRVKRSSSSRFHRASPAREVNSSSSS